MPDLYEIFRMCQFLLIAFSFYILILKLYQFHQLQKEFYIFKFLVEKKFDITVSSFEHEQLKNDHEICKKTTGMLLSEIMKKDKTPVIPKRR